MFALLSTSHYETLEIQNLEFCTFAAMKTLKIPGIKNTWETLKTFLKETHDIRQHIIIKPVY